MKLKIVNRTYPTIDSVSLTFLKPFSNFFYHAGQHANFTFTINGVATSRTYSLSSSPDFDTDLTITVRLVKDGLVSSLLVSNRIDEIELNDVGGKFFVIPSKNKKRHLIMLAGGSGITPVISMIRTILKNECESSISLIYSNRSYDSILFRDEISRLSKKYSNSFHVYHVLTQQHDSPPDFPVFFKGRLSKLILKRLLKNIAVQIPVESEYYMCGPFGFIQLGDETLKAMDVSASKIFSEVFYTPELPDTSFLYLPGQEVILDMKDGERLLDVKMGQNILEAALSENITLAHSCKQGLCGVCRAVLISGEVKLRANHVLSEDEINSRQILLCQSFPFTNDVTVKPINHP